MKKILPLGLIVGTIAIVASCDKPTAPIAKRVSASRAHYTIVPSIAPNDDPDAVHDSSSIIVVAGTDSVLIHSSTVVVEFNAGSSQADRQAAVDSIHGIIIGGRRRANQSDGFYYVGVAGDATGDSVSKAVNKLRTLPQVVFASAYYYQKNALAYVKPNDGAGWHTWASRDSVGTEHNWSAELMDLPRAWGCTTGDSTVALGIIDGSFHDVYDNSPNVVSTVASRGAGLNRITTNVNDHDTWHGDAVTDIIAAVGNNGSGMAGMMWKAAVKRMDATAIDSGHYMMSDGSPVIASQWVADGIGQLAGISGGARVINLSVGNQWPPGHTITAREDSSLQDIAGLLHRELAHLDRDGFPRPLLVIAASNSGADANTSGYTRIAHMAPDSARTIVVTASPNSTSSLSTLPSFANYGSLVQVAAPGQNVWVLDEFDEQEPMSGTSFAAPAVSGLAGLLLSFDPRQSIEQVKARIIEGAVAGGRYVGGHGYSYPIVNAYESLRLASQQPGAPLCGPQRVWFDGAGYLELERVTGGGPEALAAPMSSAFDLGVFHGGKTMVYSSNDGLAYLNWSPAGWYRDNTPVLADLPSGSYSSIHGWAHDGNAFIASNAMTMYGDEEPNLEPGTQRAQFHLYYADSHEDETHIDFGSSKGSDPVSIAHISTAYPTSGDSALISISMLRGSVYDSTYSCTDDRFVVITCHDTTTSWVPDTTYLYTMNVINGSPALNLIHKYADTVVFALGFSETGTSALATYGWYTYTQSPAGGQIILGACRTQERDTRLAAPITGSPIDIDNQDACPTDWFGATSPVAGFSADRLTPKVRLAMRGRRVVTRRIPKEKLPMLKRRDGAWAFKPRSPQLVRPLARARSKILAHKH